MDGSRCNMEMTAPAWMITGSAVGVNNAVGGGGTRPGFFSPAAAASTLSPVSCRLSMSNKSADEFKLSAGDALVSDEATGRCCCCWRCWDSDSSTCNCLSTSQTIISVSTTHSHTRQQPCVHDYPGVKPIWILLKQETVSGSGISWATCKSAPRSRQITTPAPHHTVFYRPDALLPPNQQHQSTESFKCHNKSILITVTMTDSHLSHWHHDFFSFSESYNTLPFATSIKVSNIHTRT